MPLTKVELRMEVQFEDIGEHEQSWQGFSVCKSVMLPITPSVGVCWRDPIWPVDDDMRIKEIVIDPAGAGEDNLPLVACYGRTLDACHYGNHKDARKAYKDAGWLLYNAYAETTNKSVFL